MPRPLYQRVVTEEGIVEICDHLYRDASLEEACGRAGFTVKELQDHVSRNREDMRAVQTAKYHRRLYLISKLFEKAERGDLAAIDRIMARMEARPLALGDEAVELKDALDQMRQLLLQMQETAREQKLENDEPNPPDVAGWISNYKTSLEPRESISQEFSETSDGQSGTAQ